MIRKFVTGALIVATVAGSLAATTESASARNGRNGAFAAGAIAGVVGGAILGGALSQPRYGYQPQYYYQEPQPVYVQPRCYYQRRRVPNSYDYGTHIETVKVCNQTEY